MPIRFVGADNSIRMPERRDNVASARLPDTRSASLGIAQQAAQQVISDNIQINQQRAAGLNQSSNMIATGTPVQGQPSQQSINYQTPVAQRPQPQQEVQPQYAPQQTQQQDPGLTEDQEYKLLAQQQAEFQDVTQSIPDLVMHGGGAAEVNRRIRAISAKYPGSKALIQMAGEAYDVLNAFTRKQVESSAEQISATQSKEREVRLSRERIGIQGITERLKYASGSERAAVYDQLSGKLERVANDKSLDPLSKAFVLDGLYQDVLKSNELGQSHVNDVRRYSEYATAAAGLWSQRQSMPASEYALRENILAKQFGIKDRDSRLVDPLIDEKNISEFQKITRGIQDERRRGAIDAKSAALTTRAAIGAFAKQYQNSPELLEYLVKNSGFAPNMVEAQSVVRNLNEYETKHSKAQQDIADINKQSALLRDATETDIMRILSGGAGEQGTSAIQQLLIQQLPPELRGAATNQQQRGYNPKQLQEVAKRVAAARNDALRAMEIKKRSIMQDLAKTRQMLAPYFTDEGKAGKDARKKK